MREDGSGADTDGKGVDATPRRRRPLPPRRGTDTNENARRRLGRYFAQDDQPDAERTLGLPDHFPGVPRPDQVVVPEQPPAPRRRPRPPAAARPRPGRKPPQPR